MHGFATIQLKRLNQSVLHPVSGIILDNFAAKGLSNTFLKTIATLKCKSAVLKQLTSLIQAHKGNPL